MAQDRINGGHGYSKCTPPKVLSVERQQVENGFRDTIATLALSLNVLALLLPFIDKLN